MGDDITVRPWRTGDGEGAAAVWRDTGRYFADLDPALFREPDGAGLGAWLDGLTTGEDSLRLVAERDGVIVGLLGATLHRPIATAGRQLQSDFARIRLHIDNIGVASGRRRDGVGTALMAAAEEWGIARGAEVELLESTACNAPANEFYERHLGFTAQAITFRRKLADPDR
ncbi:MAG TPA: GNAT family N-acetyltransferase [Pseudonocardiaceae bacterium]|jgi:ribosomal protein S18 acetylase RimI-like enzyme|nr:GNAT family N-acetyltransferase [Pseudonocardiaceae bacterium]